MSVITFAGPPSSVSIPSGHAGSWVAHVSGSSASVGRGILRLIGKALAEHHARRAVRELNRLDDRMLRDIGLSRSSIEHVVRGRMVRMAEDLGGESTKRLDCDCAACTRRR
jgi:uncharacterized protein YjiS (DUF1127 family)